MDGYESFDISFSPTFPLTEGVSGDYYSINVIFSQKDTKLTEIESFNTDFSLNENFINLITKNKYDIDAIYSQFDSKLKSSLYVKNIINVEQEETSRISKEKFAITSNCVDVYVMRGVDSACSTLTYRYWKSYNLPDFSANYYYGPLCGSKLDLVDIIIYQSYTSTS